MTSSDELLYSVELAALLLLSPSQQNSWCLRKVRDIKYSGIQTFDLHFNKIHTHKHMGLFKYFFLKRLKLPAITKMKKVQMNHNQT